MVLVTKKFTDFTASAVLSNGEIINNFNLNTYILNKYALIFFWPMDFTFVCPTELIALNNRLGEFNKRNVQILGISIDSEFVHSAWRKTPINNGGIGKISFPMISDIKHEIIKSYGIEHPTLGVALRAYFIIDKNGVIRHQVVNDLPLGRNINEIIRIVDAIIFYEENGEVCPAQWEQGKEGIIPTSEGISNFLEKNSRKL